MNSTLPIAPFAIPPEWPAHLAEDTLWASIGRNFLTLSNVAYGSLGGCLTHTIFTFCTFWPWYIACYSFFRAIDKHNLLGLQKYRLHPAKSEPQELNDKVTTGLKFGFWKGAVRTAAVYWLFFSHGRQNMTTSFPTFDKLVVDILAHQVLNDIFFYWFHRLEHHPYFYKNWHKVHHEFKITNVGATSWNNPSESFGLMVIANTLAMLLKFDLFTWLTSVVIGGVLMDAHVHIGYKFPWSPFNLLSDPVLHDYHHYQNSGMYSVMGFDALFGTDKKFKEYMARQELRRQQGLEEEAERRNDSDDDAVASGWVDAKAKET